MFPSSWTLQVSPEAKDKVVEWLANEGLEGVVVAPKSETVQVDFDNIDSAFRFRMQFDEELVG